MKCYYDFHIHSCLSPCGDSDMTPNNIVNMALIKGLDAIAVTDHNCAANLDAVKKYAEGRITLLYGMEVESSEEVHMLCLFADIESCKNMENEVEKSMTKIANNEKIFGEQLILNEDDEIIGKKNHLLVTACGLDVFDIVEATHRNGGVAIAAHIDKSSYSIISNLGFIPDELGIDCVEISKRGDFEKMKLEHSYLDKFSSIYSSDAHYLEDISEKINSLDVENLYPQTIINKLLRKR